MTMTTTPGPWTQDEYGFVLDTNGRTVVVEGLALGSRSTDQSRANARLIAVAPDLLEALQEIIDAADGTGWAQLDATFTKARAAIAKAKGEQ